MKKIKSNYISESLKKNEKFAKDKTLKNFSK